MNIFLSLALILIAAKCFGLIVQRLKIPAVVGELLAGVLIGPSLLNWLQPTNVLEIIADIAIVLLLFEVGLDTDFQRFKTVGAPGMRVAVVGFMLPLLFSFLFNRILFHLPLMESFFIAGALTATSIAITVRVLSDLKKRHTHAAHVVVAAAIFDDILGVLLLVLLLNFAGTGTDSLISVFKTSLILGAFVVGLLLGQSGQFKAKAIVPCQRVIAVITPVFFVMVGLSINLHDIAWHSGSIWIFTLGLLILAFMGKFLAGFVVKETRAIQVIIGISMIPRGEVGLIFAQLGLQSAILNLFEYTALVLVVMITTFFAPLLLRKAYS